MKLRPSVFELQVSVLTDIPSFFYTRSYSQRQTWQFWLVI